MKKCLLLLSGLVCALAVAQTQAQSVRYTFLLAGNKAGFQTAERAADGAWNFHFEFNDRGRGPSVDSHVLLNGDGITVSEDNQGHDYFKEKVVEHFSLKGGKAAWKNRAEQGERSGVGKAFYISISGAPQETALLAQALLKADGSLPLLPEGEARIEKRGELKVEAKGQSRTVVQYAISGLDFTPTAIWLDQDGGFFASASALWSAVVREGWEDTVPSLVKAQQAIDNQRLADLAKTLGHKTPTFAFVHANLFDSEKAEIRPAMTVVVSGNKIAAVGRDGEVTIPRGAETLDASGKTLIPGLWDMHVHLAPNDGLLNIAAGVTSVRDLANDIDELARMRAKYDAGEEIGPRVVMAGFLDGRGPYQGPTKVFADNEAEAKAAIEKYAQLGYVQIKVYSSIKPELVPRITAMAHDHGMRVSGHVPAFMNAEQFIRDGADEMQHMNFVFLNFMFDKVKDTRTPARFSEVAAHGAEVDPESDRVQAFIHLLQERHTVLDPTLSIFEGMFTDRPGTMSASFAPVADRMPVQIRRGFFYGGIPVPEGLDQRHRDSFNQMLKMTKALYDAGVPIVAGTDSLAGFALHRELELYEKAGIPAIRVLQLATIGAAQIMKRDEQVGSITPGKLADMVLVEGNPSEKISDVRRTALVVKDGTMYKSADLYNALGVKPQ
jgi:imidazolonepropionase-like amidohydrolase